MVSPTGGPKDTLAPVVLKSTPAQFSRNVAAKEFEISFDEYVTLKELPKSFFVSPPMEELPEVREKGKKLEIVVEKALIPNTTYSFNFGNSIVDNNEGNPLVNYSLTFSTGSNLDTLKLNGTVYDACTMLPVAGAYVFFYDNDSIQVPLKYKPSIIAKTDKEGIFIANTLKNKQYKIIAIDDANRNYLFDPGIDKVAFEKGLFGPVNISARRDTVSDSLWRSQLPPQVKFKMFSEMKTRQYITGKTRPEKYKFQLFFNSPNPEIKKIEFDGLTINDFFVEKDAEGDTITYWLKDATRKIADTLLANYTYMKSDSTGKLVETLEKVSWELPLSKMDRATKKDKKKDEEKAAPKVQSIVPQFSMPDGTANEDGGFFMQVNLPLTRIDTSKITLYHIDDNDKKSKVPFSIKADPKSLLSYSITSKWVEDSRYQMLIDSNAIENILKQVNDSTLFAFSTSTPSKFGTFIFDVKNVKENLIVQVLDKKYKLIRQKTVTQSGVIRFPYIKADTYIVRVIEDLNKNGIWDTGNYLKQLSPERVCYLHKEKEKQFVLRSGWENEVNVDVNEIFSNY
jgi:hypothetical protein